MSLHGPLGSQVEYPEQYSPEVLHPIPRLDGRSRLNVQGDLPFVGVDIWNAYEMSWLNERGKPLVACGEFHFPADSPNIIESKSFKLYLNSFNQGRWASTDAVQKTLQNDLSAACGAPVTVVLHRPEAWSGGLGIDAMRGQCLDEQDIEMRDYQPDAALLACHDDRQLAQSYYSHLLRSRCPVTGQPDWASVHICCDGPKLDEAALLRYLVSFRQQNDFHEQCVEQIFCDIWRQCQPESLTVYARYLRRGGLDINPWRSSDPSAKPLNSREFRQ